MFPRETLREQMGRFDYVFYAQVDSILDTTNGGFNSNLRFSPDNRSYKNEGYHPKLTVLEVFRRSSKRILKKGTLVMNNSSSICDRLFKVGERLLLFGYEGKNGGIATDICAPTWVFESEEKFMMERAKIRKASRIF
jgi:hypothetical protein